jgi:hypothetical protein
LTTRDTSAETHVGRDIGRDIGGDVGGRKQGAVGASWDILIECIHSHYLLHASRTLSLYIGNTFASPTNIER